MNRYFFFRTLEFLFEFRSSMDRFLFGQFILKIKILDIVKNVLELLMMMFSKKNRKNLQREYKN